MRFSRRLELCLDHSRFRVSNNNVMTHPNKEESCYEFSLEFCKRS